MKRVGPMFSDRSRDDGRSGAAVSDEHKARRSVQPLAAVAAVLSLVADAGWAQPSVPTSPPAPVVAAGTAPSCIVRDPELRGEYVGPCVNGYAEGEGTARGTGVQAAVYMGGFRNGYKQGRGVKFYSNGDTYSGDWANDQRSGFGVYTYGAQSPWAGDRYSGGWLLDQRHGQGVYTWGFGDRYEGAWNLGRQAGLPTAAQVHRMRVMEKLGPKLRESAPNVCSITTAGAGPERVARGSILEFLDDRVRVRITDFGSGAGRQQPVSGPIVRWELATFWAPC